MFMPLLFIVPIVTLTLCLGFVLGLTYRIPKWLQIDIGRLHAEDIRQLDDDQKKFLRKKVINYLIPAFIVTFVISNISITLAFAFRPYLVLLICIIQLSVAGLFIYKLIKIANALKSRLDITQ